MRAEFHACPESGVPPGRGRFSYAIQAINCLATIVKSLRDKKPTPLLRSSAKLTRMGSRRTIIFCVGGLYCLNLCVFAPLADVAKGGEGAKSALREIFRRLFCVLCVLSRLFPFVSLCLCMRFYWRLFVACRAEGFAKEGPFAVIFCGPYVL
jgi:hypothetical protein